MAKRRTRAQLANRVVELRENLISNKTAVLEALQNRHAYLLSASEQRRLAEHVAWEREAGARPQKTWRGEFNWIDVNENNYRYDKDYEAAAARDERWAEQALAKIAEATAMVNLTKTMLAENERLLRQADFWLDLFWPVTIWLAIRKHRASQPR